MIRPLTLLDRARVDAIEADADTRFAALSVPPRLPAGPREPHVLAEAVQDGLAFGLESTDGLVGFIYGSVVGDAAFIEEVSVRTDAAGQRIGARLIERFEQAARELGLARVVLTTFREVPWNAPYYARLGFAVGAGSLGASLLSAESTRGLDEGERVAMSRPIRRDASGWSTEVLQTAEADAVTLALVRHLLDECFEGRFSDDDWAASLGGLHIVVRHGGQLVAHGSAVPGTLWVGAEPREAGYLQAVAVAPELRHQGLGTRVMRALTSRLRAHHDLLVLCGTPAPFFESLGWRRWRGPTYVVRGEGLVRTPDVDGELFVLDGLRPVASTTGAIAREGSGSSLLPS